MVLFKVLQEFLLPSVFIFVLILIGLFFLLRLRTRKIGRLLIFIGLILYYVFSTTFTVNLILGPLENQYQLLEKNDISKADTIVLLLGGAEADILRASEVLRLYNQNLTADNQNFKIIVSGTNPLNSRDKEAERVKDFLVNRGIASENVILEDESRNTAESAKNIKKMLGEKPFFLVTSAYHMFRSMEVFQKMETNPIPAPTDFKIEKNYSIVDLFPHATNLEKSNAALHEYFGILFYRLKY